MILVTGSTGHVGSEVLEQLIAKGAGVRAAYLSAEKAAQAPAGVETTLLDFTKPETIATSLRGIEKVFLVAPSAPNQPELEGNVTDAAKKAGVKHLVKLSVIGAAGKGGTFMGWHRQAEEKIEASGVPFTFLRCNGFFQNMINYNAGTIQSKNAFYSAMQDARVSHVDLRDIGAVAVKALTNAGHEGKAYDITGPEALTNTELAAALSKAVGRTINCVDLPPANLKQAMLGMGIPDWYADALLDLYRFYRTGAAAVVSDAVVKITGRKAGTFEAFAREFAGSFQKAA